MRRDKPYSLRWPASPEQWEQIDDMLQSLFDDTGNGSIEIDADQVTSGILTVPFGGTGFGTYAIGDMLYADTATTLAKLVDVATGKVLRSGGVGVAPAYGQVVLTTDVTGILPVANGGTGFSSYAIGDILYADGAASLAKLADVAVGAYLRSGGVTTAPLWSTLILPNAATTGDVFIATSTNTMGRLADVTAGSYLRAGGVSTAPVWSTITIPNAATTGDIWQATATSTITALAGVAVGSYLRSGGVATANLWSTLTLPNASAQGDLFLSTAANVMTVLAKNTSATRYLSNTGVTNNPAWAQINISDGLTIASQATGDILYASSATVWARLAIGASTTVLHGGTTPSYAAVTLTTEVTGILPIANGGTNSSTALSGTSIMISNGSAVVQGALGTTTTLLHGNAAGAPTYSAVSLTADVTGTLPLGNGGTGTATTFTDGSVVFAAASGIYSQDNATFFWDRTNKRLGIGIATPQGPLQVKVATDLNFFVSTVTAGFTSFSGINDNNSANVPFEFRATKTFFSADAGGKVGLNVQTPVGRLHSIDTSEPMRLGYDTSNYAPFVISSTGSLSISPIGTNPNILLVPSGTGYTQFTNTVGIGIAPVSGAFLQVKVASNIDFMVNSVTAGFISFNAINDTNAANIPLEFRASYTAISAGGFTVGGTTNPGAGNLDAQGKLTNTGIGAASSGTTAVLIAGNEFRPLLSSRRFKENIRPWATDALAVLTKLPAVQQFDYRDQTQLVNKVERITSGGKGNLGLIAEDVALVFPEAVNIDATGQPYSLRFDVLTTLLIAALQQQQQQLDKLTQKLVK